MELHTKRHDLIEVTIDKGTVELDVVDGHSSKYEDHCLSVRLTPDEVERLIEMLQMKSQKSPIKR